MKIAIHSVFIVKENILFLEQWIYYHILLGFNKFYLYDNSKINKVSGFDKKYENVIVGNKINKYNINYDEIVNLTDEKIDYYMKKICEKYECIEIIEWSPMNEDGNILYNQREAHNDCLNKMKKDNIDWCANIDMDEYIVIKNHNSIDEYILSLPKKNTNNIQMSQVRFETRFNYLNDLIINITNSEVDNVPIGHSPKNIYNVKNTIKTNVHSVTVNGFTHKVKNYEIFFNHYKLTRKCYKHIDNININIKNQMNNYSFISIDKE